MKLLYTMWSSERGAQLVLGEKDRVFSWWNNKFRTLCKIILMPSFNQLTEDEKTYRYFMQYRARNNNSMNASAEVFGKRVISRGLSAAPIRFKFLWLLFKGRANIIFIIINNGTTAQSRALASLTGFVMILRCGPREKKKCVNNPH
jgi:hypothetical protein